MAEHRRRNIMQSGVKQGTQPSFNTTTTYSNTNPFDSISKMRFQTLTLVSTILALAAAQKVEQDDIPTQCTSVCADLVSTALRCDRDNNDNDAAELQCICTSQNANTLVPNCELCVRSNRNNGNDNDVNDVLTSCSFQRASQTISGSASASGSGTVVPTVISTSGTVVSTSVTVANTAAPAASTGGAMPKQTGAAVGLGALGLALGLL
ncbi:hypothetical protein HBI25_215830 [Parastagonospora nodorum]|nr:hypothetical protein HBH53_074590 [Parastagonospora nodorum]KAH4034010.1 hypothetical protein HBI09_115630 [Parastagonospora nodorum]KAH4062013.1 hypothetical protein HBH50_213200 [Parastagonospora nodorum]KAH4088691.1 hypothetical protein HBH48_117770 [Parastagonospora nodorum]KAH4104126.1 hypothetical protein HBH46_098380 [Parastagonospora nodorum]